MNQFCLNESAQRTLQVSLTDGMNRMQEIVGKFISDHRGNLEDFLSRSKPIQPRHQRVLQSRGNFALSQSRVTAFEHRPGQLLDKKWHAAGAFDYGIKGFLCKCVTRSHVCYHLLNFAR